MQAQWRLQFPLAREELWPFVGDTDFINRHAGLPPVSYRYEPQPGGGSRSIATIRLGPLAVAWEEPPFVWERPNRVAVTRLFLRGPFAEFSSDVRLADADGGTAVTHRVTLEPRNALGTVLVPLVMAVAERGARRAYAKAAAAASRLRDEAVAPASRARLPAPGQTDALTIRLLDLVERARALAGVRAPLRAIVPALARFLGEADERDIARIRPYALADRLPADRDALLAFFLAGTREGLFDLSWDVLCTSCRGPKNRFSGLGELQTAVHCDACNIEYGATFDRNVEVTFSAAPLGRGGDVPIYCIAGPHNSQQTFAQTTASPGETAILQAELSPGRYALEVPPMRHVAFTLLAGPGLAEMAVALTPDELTIEPREAVGAGVRMTVENRTPAVHLLKLSDAELPSDVATAADVTALQSFRDLFSSEVLAEGVELSIRSLTIVFTDLVGSTMLYSRSGDAPAFRLVREHFSVMEQLVREHRGAIVKTIGDAVMAAFSDPGDAFDAAVRFAPSVGTVMGPQGPLRMRVGVHAGPCIAMRANDRLDYFGTTVNLAARIQHVAEAGEVLVSQKTAELPPLARRLEGQTIVREEIAFKGFDAPVDVLRVAPALSGEEGAADR